MKVAVEVDGITRTVDVSVDRITLRESVEIQKMIGGDEWDAFVAGKLRPVALQAVLYCKLKAEVPGVSVDDFDFALSNLGPSDDTNPTNGS